MILTFCLELIAAVSPPEYDATVVNLIVFVVVGFALAFLPGCIYLVTEWRYCCLKLSASSNSNGPMHYSLSVPSRPGVALSLTRKIVVKCWKTVEAVLCAVFGPFFYYYGDNITKVVDTVSTGNITGNTTLACSDDCQSLVRASAVAALFAFILISNLNWQPNSTSKYLWGPVVDLLLKLVPLDAFYSALLQVASMNTISTSTMFCRGIDAVFFWTVFVIANIYAIYFIGQGVMQYYRFKWRTRFWGFVIWVIFAVYLLADKLLPLNFSLCYVSDDDMAAVMQRLHIARAVLSILCAISIVMLYVVPECTEYIYKYKIISHTILATLLETKILAQIKKKLDKTTVQSIVHLVTQSVARSIAKEKAELEESVLLKKLNAELDAVISVTKTVANAVKAHKSNQTDLVTTIHTKLVTLLEPILVNAIQKKELDETTFQSIVHLVTQSVARSIAKESVLLNAELEESVLLKKLNAELDAVISVTKTVANAVKAHKSISN